MIRINGIKLPVGHTDAEFHDAIAKKLHTDTYNLERIVKQSVDARDKENLLYLYSVDVSSPREEIILRKNGNRIDIMLPNEKDYCFPFDFSGTSDQVNERPVVIGAGPAGYFAALYLARAGLNPIVYERGNAVEVRKQDVENFWKTGVIDPSSNVSFGEGGAGTFSDGKLNTGIKDKEGRIRAVIRDFVSFGAPESISYLAKPHIGTDCLFGALQKMREEILRLGGEIHFGSCLTELHEEADGISYRIESKDGEAISGHTNALVLAIGHSARDTFTMLHKNKIPMEAKAFACGLRIEHRADVINRGQYGTGDRARLLPAADYKFTYRSTEGRSVYSFCMCPGGYVVAAASGTSQAVVNGMSDHARDGVNSNAAVVVGVTPEDFFREGYGDHGILAGMYFQEAMERRAFEIGEGSIPVSTFADFEQGQASTKCGSVTPQIRGLWKFSNLKNCLPPYVNHAIIEGVRYYGTKLSGYDAPDAILSGVETRTSSPVRILRNEHLMSDAAGLFPCGEGAGYAGGITSAAVDGIKVAEAVCRHLLKHPV